MRARNILLLLTFTCGLTATLGVIANYLVLGVYTQQDAQRNVGSVVSYINHDLKSLIDGFRVQVAIQSTLPEIRDYLVEGDRDLTPVLNSICDLSNSSLCYLLNVQGDIIAVNDVAEKEQLLKDNFAYRPYFKEAISVGSALQLAVGATTHRRGVYFSHRIEDETGALLGVVVNKFPPGILEDKFDGLPGIVLLIDADGVIFASSRKEWVLQRMPVLDSTLSPELGYSLSDPAKTISLAWLNTDTVQDSAGIQYKVFKQTSSLLPGWSLVYLNEHNSSWGGEFGHRILYLMSGISLLVFSLIIFLYREGRKQIEQRVQVEASLRRSEARLLQLSEVSTEAVIMHRGDHILDFNLAAERLFQCRGDQLKNLLLLELFNTQGRTEIEKLYSHGESSFECDALRPDGTSFNAIVNYQQTQVDDEIVGISCIRDITELKEHQQKVLYQAQFDALTNLPNRVLMHEKLHSAIVKAQSEGNLLTLMFIDLDDFKWVNDSMGHEEGDELLIKVANRLRATLGGEHTLSRYGGDEFILVIEGQEDLYLTEEIALNILSALSREFRVKDRSYFISGSIGIAVSPTDGTVPDELLRKADTAMYRVKAAGRNGFNFYTPDMNEDVIRNLEIGRQLRHALERQELSLHFQPVFDLKQQRVVAAEALIRWNNPELGQVSPDEFIPVAEQTGLIVPIGDWIILEVCSRGQSWRETLGQDFRMGVNVSPVQFRDGHILSALRSSLSKTGFPPTQLVMEITEGLLIRNDEETAQTLNQIKAMGIILAMDDFGTGYSSLGYLKQFPFDIVKVDRSFIQDLEDDQGDQQLVQAAITMAKGLGLRVVAEGVENEFQYNFLNHIDCDSIQGYFFGRPVPAEEFVELVNACNERYRYDLFR
ncbi:EAL domain-containing protein [uncultured Amphritea sp.]|uniref:bifunctional diguanylate cyclase/phosphodiesterase n=1 Tax=uncultured Amphritea sp. TaxID=981605 RepID=UPI0026092CE9|nr:EAL domain-containing protein [uncultured Amphritea sp.]